MTVKWKNEKNSNRSLLVCLFLISFPLFPIYTADNAFWEQGETLMMNDKPGEAIPLLESALEVDPGNEKIYLYLGLAYQQTGAYAESVQVLRDGVSRTEKSRDRFYYNIGNGLMLLENYSLADEFFTKAIKENPALHQAYLNRANSRVRQEALSDSVRDYKVYLSLNPGAEQRESIEKMIALLEQTVQERREQRLAEEARRREEEARQKALLDSVLQSLDNADSDTTHLSAESEDIQDTELEIDIEE